MSKYAKQNEQRSQTASGRRESTTLAATAGTISEPAGLLTVPEVLARLRISRRTLHDHISEGRVPAIRLGKRLLFSWPVVLEALLRQQRASE
jgi:excisionase family DNA binding protein